MDIKLTPLLNTLELKKIPDSIYFSDEYKNYISNSRLGLMKSGGPEAFFEGFKPIYSSSLALGKKYFFILLILLYYCNNCKSN